MAVVKEKIGSLTRGLPVVRIMAESRDGLPLSPTPEAGGSWLNVFR